MQRLFSLALLRRIRRSVNSDDFLGDRRKSCLCSGYDAVSVLVRFLVRNDVSYLCGVGQFLDRGDGLGDVEFVEVFDGKFSGVE